MFFRNFMILITYIVIVSNFIAPGFTFSEALSADSIIATVGAEKIFESELDESIKNIPEPFKEAFREKALNQLIDTRVFYNLGVKTELNETEIYHQKIERAKKLILADLFIERKLKPKIKVTEGEIEKYYKTNSNKFSTGKKIVAAHIIAKYRELAMSIKQKINPGNFEKLAATFSKKNPDVDYYKTGWIESGKKKRGRMPKAFEDAAFALKKGEISNIIKTKMGYHIIKVMDLKPGWEKSFDEVKVSIKKRLTAQKLKSLKQKYIDSAKVKIISKNFK